MNCYLCKDSGITQVAHRILPGGKGVCRFHFEGSMMPAATPVMDVDAVHEPPKEGMKMPTGVRREIDISQLKRDYEEGMAWPELSKKFGAARMRMTKELLAAGATMRGRGHRATGPLSGNGRKPRSARVPKVQRLAAVHPANGEGGITINVFPDFLDGIWARLSNQEKAQLLNGLASIAKSPDR